MNQNLISDNALVSQLKADEKAAFQEIYRRYWKTLYGVAARKVRTDIAEEIVQDVFVNLWKNRQNNIDNLQYYLFSAVKYGVLNHIKSGLTAQRYLNFIQKEPYIAENTTEQGLNLAELTQQIEAIVETLPDKTKTVFLMSRFDYLSVKEIAAQLNLSEKAVEYHITQALKTLRKALHQ